MAVSWRLLRVECLLLAVTWRLLIADCWRQHISLDSLSFCLLSSLELGLKEGLCLVEYGGQLSVGVCIMIVVDLWQRFDKLEVYGAKFLPLLLEFQDSLFDEGNSFALSSVLFVIPDFVPDNRLQRYDAFHHIFFVGGHG